MSGFDPAALAQILVAVFEAITRGTPHTAVVAAIKLAMEKASDEAMREELDGR